MSINLIEKQNQVIVADPDSPVAILTCWTPREKVAQKLDYKGFCAIGNLYNAADGIDFVIRNLLANKTIRTLVITGADNSGSGQAMMDFFRNGFYLIKHPLTDKPVWKIKSTVEAYIGADMNASSLNSLRGYVSAIKVDRIAQLPSTLPVVAASSERGAWGEPEHYPAPEANALVLPSEESAHVVRGRTIPEVYLKILHTLHQFGVVGETHYDSNQREILNLVSVVENETWEFGADGFMEAIPDYMPARVQDVETLSKYIDSVLLPGTLEDDDGAKYTYGDRICAYFGIDQLEEVIAKLVKEPISRSAVVNLWDSRTAERQGGSPCLNHIYFRLRDNKLHMTATIRSNDMFKAWPENAYALRSLQRWVRDSVTARLYNKGETHANVQMGTLTVVSQSAHIYQEDYEMVEWILAHHWQPLCDSERYEWDKKGNFVITVEAFGRHRINVEHYAYENGPLIRRYVAKDAYDAMRQLSDSETISTHRHAIYIGTELQKAELALRYPSMFTYVQDRDLKIEGVS
jgi:thymidylate synthase